jgi:hypothetical protein
VATATTRSTNTNNLRRRARQEGHVRVPQQHVEDGTKLGGWMCAQPAQKREEKLISKKEHQLNQIGFIWNVCDVRWDAMVRALTQFKL